MATAKGSASPYGLKISDAASRPQTAPEEVHDEREASRRKFGGVFTRRALCRRFVAENALHFRAGRAHCWLGSAPRHRLASVRGPYLDGLATFDRLIRGKTGNECQKPWRLPRSWSGARCRSGPLMHVIDLCNGWRHAPITPTSAADNHVGRQARELCCRTGSQGLDPAEDPSLKVRGRLFPGRFSRSARASRGWGSTLVTHSLNLSHPPWETLYL